LAIPQIAKPLRVGFGLANFNHALSVSYGIQKDKQ
jgi:hypothetical protein